MRVTTEALETETLPFTLEVAGGIRLAGMIQRAIDVPSDAPLIVLPPTFGRTMRDYAVVSWFLARNGFRVLRYDNTFHVGESDGDTYHFSPLTAIADLSAVTRLIEREIRPTAWGVVAFSLSFRFVLRALCHRTDVRMLFGIIGVVNLRATLTAVVGYDPFIALERRTHSDADWVLGHLVSYDSLRDAVRSDLEDLESTRIDLANSSFPVLMVVGKKDDWVALSDVELAFSEEAPLAARRVLILPGVNHDLHKNPIAAALALEQMVLACHQYVSGTPVAMDDVAAPSLPEMVRVRKLEKAQANSRSLSGS